MNECSPIQSFSASSSSYIYIYIYNTFCVAPSHAMPNLGRLEWVKNVISRDPIDLQLQGQKDISSYVITVQNLGSKSMEKTCIYIYIYIAIASLWAWNFGFILMGSAFNLCNIEHDTLHARENVYLQCPDPRLGWSNHFKLKRVVQPSIMVGGWFVDYSAILNS